MLFLKGDREDPAPERGVRTPALTALLTWGDAPSLHPALSSLRLCTASEGDTQAPAELRPSEC